jgi:acyl-CoA thioesterase FadM
MTIDATEYLLSREPFIVRRTVRWGDCDPAGVVYTGRFTEYLLGAIAFFKSHMAGGSMHDMSRKFDVDLPCRGMSFDFTGTLWPGDVVDIRCVVGEVRTRSFDIECTAAKPDGTPVFTARFSPICVERTVRKGKPIPPELRDLLIRFQTSSVENA